MTHKYYRSVYLIRDVTNGRLNLFIASIITHILIPSTIKRAQQSQRIIADSRDRITEKNLRRVSVCKDPGTRNAIWQKISEPKGAVLMFPCCISVSIKSMYGDNVDIE